jgi:hypothetical protein
MGRNGNWPLPSPGTTVPNGHHCETLQPFQQEGKRNYRLLKEMTARSVSQASTVGKARYTVRWGNKRAWQVLCASVWIRCVQAQPQAMSSPIQPQAMGLLAWPKID